MSEQQKVYVVTTGAYSNYGIEGVFSTQEKAQAFMDAFPCDECYDGYNEIAEWTLDPNERLVQEGLGIYHVTMRRDGTAERCEIAAGFSSPSHCVRGRRNWPGCKGSALVATIWAKDEQHAVKIANEIRGRMIVHGEWPADQATA